MGMIEEFAGAIRWIDRYHFVEYPDNGPEAGRWSRTRDAVVDQIGKLVPIDHAWKASSRYLWPARGHHAGSDRGRIDRPPAAPRRVDHRPERITSVEADAVAGGWIGRKLNSMPRGMFLGLCSNCLAVTVHGQ